MCGYEKQGTFPMWPNVDHQISYINHIICSTTGTLHRSLVSTFKEPSIPKSQHKMTKITLIVVGREHVYISS